MEKKHLQGKGEADYDYQNDILFFKSSEREYDSSLELDKLVLDIDKEGYVVGVQVFDASKFLNIKKNLLMKIPKWEFTATVENNRIFFNLVFNIVIRNKIIERNPMIIERTGQDLPNSKLVCAVS